MWREVTGRLPIRGAYESDAVFARSFAIVWGSVCFDVGLRNGRHEEDGNGEHRRAMFVGLPRAACEVWVFAFVSGAAARAEPATTNRTPTAERFSLSLPSFAFSLCGAVFRIAVFLSATAPRVRRTVMASSATSSGRMRGARGGRRATSARGASNVDNEKRPSLSGHDENSNKKGRIRK